jgi:chitinase
MGNRVVAFLPGYVTNKTRKFDISTIPGDRITDLVYCFGAFKQQGGNWVVAFPEPHDADPGSTRSNFGQLVALKSRWPALNVMISIGGWNHSHQPDPNSPGGTAFSAVSATPVARSIFVKSCIDLFIKPVKAGIGPLFGGIDLDWEFPDNPTDRSNLTLLLKEFRKQLDAVRNGLALSACIVPNKPDEIEFPSLAADLDWVNIMAYLAHAPAPNPSGQVTDFNSPIYSSPLEPSPTWNIDASVRELLATAFPARKLVLGINAYAQTYSGVGNARQGVYQSYSGPGPGSYGKVGELTYKDLVANYLPKYESHWDGVTQSAYLYSATDQVWISFDSVHSVQAKLAFVRQHNMGGLMLWEVSGDLPAANSESLIEAMSA